jgi:uncharacterized membrane protein
MLLALDPLFTNDAVVAGLLLGALGLVFYTSGLPAYKTFYKYVPALLMCYLIPAIFNSLGLISSDMSKAYTFSKNYLLPTALVLMTLSIDLKAVFKLGPKALIMFFTATIGIIIGGPIALLIVSSIFPDILGGVGPDEIWRGLSTLAGSWIGGGANQAAMLEVFEYNPEKYGAMVLVDIVVANIWMAFILLGAGKSDKIDKWLKADNSSIEALKNKMQTFSESISKNPTLRDLMIILGVGMAATGLAHFGADLLSPFFQQPNPKDNSFLASGFFWLVVLATTIGLTLSFTKARNLEGSGASKIGSVFIYILVASIGMKMDIKAIFDPNNLAVLLIGIIWMATHVALLFLVAKWVRAPFFFLAVGSKANVGGAASAPVVAAAFHPALAPVGVLLAVLGYAIGTYGAIFCAQLMELVSK